MTLSESKSGGLIVTAEEGTGVHSRSLVRGKFGRDSGSSSSSSATSGSSSTRDCSSRDVSVVEMSEREVVDLSVRSAEEPPFESSDGCELGDCVEGEGGSSFRGSEVEVSARVTDSSFSARAVVSSSSGDRATSKESSDEVGGAVAWSDIFSMAEVIVEAGAVLDAVPDLLTA